MSHGFYAAAGFEAKAFGLVSLRAGYSAGSEILEIGPLAGLTFGMGISLLEMKIEYTAESFGDLGFTHMASVGYSFAPSREEQDGKLFKVLSDFMAGQYYNEGMALYSEKKYAMAAKKFRAALDINPAYSGAEEWKEKAEKEFATEQEERKIEVVFEEGVNAYDKGEYKKALEKWEAVKAKKPAFNDVAVWIEDAKKMIKYGPKIKEAIKYFRDGYRQYGSCRYTEAVDLWLKAVDLDPENRKYQVMLEKARQKSLELNDGLMKAAKDIEGGRVVEGAVRLRQFAAVCPTNSTVAGKMDAMKEIIAGKCRELYMQGLDKYVTGMTMDAVKAWSQIQELDPNSEFNKRAEENINKAKLKLKNIKELNKK
jgi:tetratricopeptide (TPR) repeat protein